MPHDEYSVLLAVYALEKPEYLQASLNSLITQTVLPRDIVIVCDGPLTAELNEIIHAFETAHPGLFTVVRLSENRGHGAASREGLSYCRCELVARQDSDDISHPDRMERLLTAFQEDPALDMVGSAVSEFAETPDKETAVRRLPQQHEKILKFARRRCPFNHPSVLFRKSAVLAAGGYDGGYQLFEDYDLWVRMLQAGAKTRNLPDKLVHMRAGKALYKRRGGRRYFQHMKTFRKSMRTRRFSTRFDYGLAITMQGTVCFVPNRVRMFIYRHLLHL